MIGYSENKGQLKLLRISLAILALESQRSQLQLGGSLGF